MSEQVDTPVVASGKALAQWRKRRSVELALAGLPYDEIAAQVGFKNRGTAHRTVMRALNENVVDGVEDYRRVELARLDTILNAHWAEATSGSAPKSAELCLKVITQRSRLLGLENQVSVQTALPVVVSSANYVQDLRVIAGELAS